MVCAVRLKVFGRFSLDKAANGYTILRAWAKLLVTVAIIKAVGGPFYWFYFPYAIHTYGLKKGFWLLFAIQLLSSVIIWRLYDVIGKDLIGIVEVKSRWDDFIVRIKSKTYWNRIVRWCRRMTGRRLAPGRFGHGSYLAAKFFFLTDQLMPWMVNLCFRTDGVPRRPVAEFSIILGSTALSNVWWALWSEGFLQLIWPTIKNTVNALFGS